MADKEKSEFQTIRQPRRQIKKKLSLKAQIQAFPIVKEWSNLRGFPHRHVPEFNRGDNVEKDLREAALRTPLLAISAKFPSALPRV